MQHYFYHENQPSALSLTSSVSELSIWPVRLDFILFPQSGLPVSRNTPMFGFGRILLFLCRACQRRALPLTPSASQLAICPGRLNLLLFPLSGRTVSRNTRKFVSGRTLRFSVVLASGVLNQWPNRHPKLVSVQDAWISLCPPRSDLPVSRNIQKFVFSGMRSRVP